MVIGVGFDCNPMVFGADEKGIWYVKLTKKLLMSKYFGLGKGGYLRLDLDLYPFIFIFLHVRLVCLLK